MALSFQSSVFHTTEHTGKDIDLGMISLARPTSDRGGGEYIARNDPFLMPTWRGA